MMKMMLLWEESRVMIMMTNMAMMTMSKIEKLPHAVVARLRAEIANQIHPPTRQVLRVRKAGERTIEQKELPNVLHVIIPVTEPIRTKIEPVSNVARVVLKSNNVDKVVAIQVQVEEEQHVVLNRLAELDLVVMTTTATNLPEHAVVITHERAVVAVVVMVMVIVHVMAVQQLVVAVVGVVATALLTTLVLVVTDIMIRSTRATAATAAAVGTTKLITKIRSEGDRLRVELLSLVIVVADVQIVNRSRMYVIAINVLVGARVEAGLIRQFESSKRRKNILRRRVEMEEVVSAQRSEVLVQLMFPPKRVELMKMKMKVRIKRKVAGKLKV